MIKINISTSNSNKKIAEINKYLNIHKQNTL